VAVNQNLPYVREVSDLGGQTEIEDALAKFDAVKTDLETAELFTHQGVPGQTNIQKWNKWDKLNGQNDDK